MLDTTEPTSRSTAPLTQRLLAIASKRGLIGAAGVFSVIAGSVLGGLWVQMHRDYWKDDWLCPDGFGFSSNYRNVLSAIALSAGIAAAVALLRIATAQGTSKTVVGYWVASITLWLTLATMVFMAVSASCWVEFAR